jgi:hypothetical protein
MAADGLPTLPPATQDIYLAKLLVIQLAFPAFYELLSDNPSVWKTYEERLIKGTPEQQKNVLADFPELRPFAEDVLLRRFMGATSTTPDGLMPPAPAEEVVAALLRATSLVSDPSANAPTSGSRPANSVA